MSEPSVMRTAKMIESWIEDHFRASDIMLNCGNSMKEELVEIIERGMGTATTEFPNTVTRHTCSCRHEEKQEAERNMNDRTA